MGHRPADVWEYTPRRLVAFLFIADRRRRMEKAEALQIETLGARGDKDAIKRRMEEWTNQ